jgi:hypothetical protein
MVHGDRYTVIRQRETYADLIRGERTLADIGGISGLEGARPV